MASKGSSKKDSGAEDIGTVIGRKAGRLFKTGGPRVKKLVEDNRPRAEQAGRDALRYAQEHEDEIRGLAMKGVRMRLGPLGTALDAMNNNASGGDPAQSKQPVCGGCNATNELSAKFCSQCGTKLQAS